MVGTGAQPLHASAQILRLNSVLEFLFPLLLLSRPILRIAGETG